MNLENSELWLIRGLIIDEMERRKIRDPNKFPEPYRSTYIKVVAKLKVLGVLS